MHAGMREQKQHASNPQRPLIPFLERDAQEGDKQETKSIISSNDCVFIEREIPETEEKLLKSVERCIADKQVDGPSRNAQVERLHDDGRRGQTAERHQKEIPRPRMSLIFEGCKKLKDGSIIPRKESCLDFVTPHFMVDGSESTHGEEEKRDTKGVVRLRGTRERASSGEWERYRHRSQHDDVPTRTLLRRLSKPNVGLLHDNERFPGTP